MHTSPAPSYLHDLLDQPQAVRDTLDGLAEQSLPGSIPARLASGALRRIVFTGMGSSYFAFYPLYQTAVGRGHEAHLVETSELLYSLPALLQPDTLVVAASQSGRSAEVVSLVERKGEGFTLLGVTNTPDSPLANGSDAHVLTQAGEEMTVSCKTYLATLLALAWLDPALAGQPTAPVLDELRSALPAIESYLGAWQAHVSELKERLSGVRDVFLVGRGASLAAAETGGLIMKESTHMHGEGMSSAAFRHGPFDMLSPEVFVLIYAGRGPVEALNRRLYADIRALGGLAALAAPDAAEPVFRLPAVPDVALPLVEILPVQMMTVALAELRGHEPGRFTYSRKVTTTE